MFSARRLEAREDAAQSAPKYAHPEIEFHTYERAPEAGVYRGVDAVRKYNEELREPFESFEIEVEEVVDAGQRVIVTTTQHVMPKGGRHQIDVSMTEVWTIRDGLLAERHSYATKDQALAAVGLGD